MRFIHFADIHIGVENYGRPASKADLDALPEFFSPDIDRNSYLGMSTRLLDFLSSFDEIVDFAIKEKVDLVVFAGDAYKNRDPSQTHQREFARRIARLIEANIPVFLVIGNHDIPHASSRATSLEIFPTLSIPKVYVADHLRTYTIDTNAGKLQVIAIPWVRRGTILSQEEARGLSPEEITEFIEDRITERLQKEAESLDPTIPTIIVGHITVSGATTSTEKSMMLGHDHVVLPSNLSLPNIDYVALGHVHKHQVIESKPPIIYSGSLQKVDFSEENDTKGFCLVTLDPEKSPATRADWKFIATHSRPFITIETDITESTIDPTNSIIETINKHDISGSVVRMKISVPEIRQSEINDTAIKDALKAAHFIAPFKKEIVKQQRPRLDASAEGLTPYQALEKYIDGKDQMDKQFKKSLIELGAEIIQTEESET